MYMLVFAIGFPLGFFGSGIFSGLAVYLAELYPTELRGAGQGFGYNIGRGIGAVGPAAIGVAAARVGLSDALALAASSYGLCLIALLFLPALMPAQAPALPPDQLAMGKMWTFENPPLAYLEQEYGFKPAQKRLDSLRLAETRPS